MREANGWVPSWVLLGGAAAACLVATAFAPLPSADGAAFVLEQCRLRLPFSPDRVSWGWLWTVWSVAFLATGVAAAILAPSSKAAGPGAIIAFEFAGNKTTAEALIASWHPKARWAVWLNTWLDVVLFIPCYAALLFWSCLMASHAIEARATTEPPIAATVGALTGHFGVVLAGSHVLTAVLDWIEDLALLLMLRGNAEHPRPQVAEFLPRLALGCTLPKWALIWLAVIYSVAGAAIGLSTLAR